MSLVRQSQHGNTNKTKEVLAAAGRKNTSEHLTGHHMTAQDELSSGSRGEKRVKKAHIKLRRSQHCTWVRVGTCRIMTTCPSTTTIAAAVTTSTLISSIPM